MLKIQINIRYPTTIQIFARPLKILHGMRMWYSYYTHLDASLQLLNSAMGFILICNEDLSEISLFFSFYNSHIHNI